MLRSFLIACFLTVVCSTSAWAQKNEVSLIVGGGRLSGSGGSVGASAGSFAYTRSLIGGLAAEGSIDFFFVDNGSVSKDDYGAVQASLVYHFVPVRKRGSLIPYLVAGIGKVSTDFTEIPGEKIYRFGGGVKYYFSDNHGFGLRVELRDEITRQGLQGYPITGSTLHLVSLRGGFSYRF